MNLNPAQPERGTQAGGTSSARSASRGFRTVLLVVYGVFAVSASARSLVQICTKFDAAPLAYSLSLGAALTYLAITVLMARKNPPRPMLLALIALELAGVLVVGTMSITHPELLEDATVWSKYGAGYGYVPLALPLIAGVAIILEERKSRRIES